MTLKFLFGCLIMAMAASPRGFAGSLAGKVSGAPAGSVVWVDEPSAQREVSGKTFLIDQRGLLFNPHILVVPVGATVEFLNSDKEAHNVFWIAIGGNKKLGHNLGTWPQGEKRSFTFDTPGVVPLLCNVHPEMSAYVVVAPTSHYATTDASGAYEIRDIPDGAHNVTVWHEGMKQQTRQITVSGATAADFSLSK
jgi:plastocyanin